MKTREIVKTALICAAIIICSSLSIPIPFAVPITLQTFAVSLSGYVLKSKTGLITVVLYILLGLLGLPVFSSFGGGAGVILGLTGGFILGFLPMVYVTGIKTKKKLTSFLLGISGLFLCHIFGIMQYSIISKTSLVTSFLTVSMLYLPKDIILVILAKIVSDKINTERF